MPLQGAAVRVRRALSSLGAGAVQGVAAVGPWGLTGSITFTPCQKGSVFGCCPKICVVILGLCWRNQF